MRTVQTLFNELGGPTAVGRIIGVKPSTASEMKRRGSIPVEYWPRLIAGAETVAGSNLTYENLVLMHHHREVFPENGTGGQDTRPPPTVEGAQ